jgi:predicted permease
MLPPRVRRALRLPLGRRRRVETETDDEIRFHLAARADSLVATGLTRAEAESEALRRFGVLDDVRPQLLAAARHREEKLTMIERFDALRDDLRYAIRQLRRSPGFSTALALTFALGIGANATMFEILDRLLFRPPAFMPDAEHVGRVYLRQPRPDGTERIDNNISYLRYTELQDHTRAFAQTAAVFQDNQRVVGSGNAAEAVTLGLVSASFWSMFDAPPVVGRYFTADEDRPPRGTSVIVLGYGYWQSRFGGDPKVLGRPLRVDGKPYTIIGIAPKGFHGIWATSTSAYVPITAGGFDMTGNERYHLEHNMSWLEMIARLGPGVTPEAANAALTRAYRQSRVDAAAARPGATPITAQSLALTRGEFAPLPMDRGPKRSESAKVATWLAGVAVIVLLIACANVANLLIARGIRRRREIAVRVALGVGRGRLVAQLLTESVVVALLGGVLGLALAHWGGGAMRRVLLPDVDWSAVPVFDPRILLFTTITVVVTGLVSGLAPAMHALRADVTASLKAGEREGGGQRARLRSGLLIAQAALSVVLLIGAVLFVRSLHNVQTLDLGWDVDRVLHVRLDFRGTDIKGDEQQKAFVARAVARARTVPGVVSASSTVSVPFWMTWSDDVFVPGMDSSDHQRTYVLNSVGDDYLATMGTRLLRGRTVSSRDLPNGAKVAVINEAMGKLLWKGKDPLGQCVRIGADTAPCREIVGIAEDIKFGALGDDESMQVYLPASQGDMSGGLIVRAAGDPRALAEPLRREIQRMLPGYGYASVKSLSAVLDPVVRQWRLGATMFTIFGALALLLAAVGLYGVIAYDVAQRMREMGVRVALGAQSADIRRLVLWQGIRVAAVGVTLGVIVAFVTVRYVEKLLFDTRAHDPVAFGAAVATILVVAVLASLIPARRATRVDPVVALRAE